jgi:hypothetical protein
MSDSSSSSPSAPTAAAPAAAANWVILAVDYGETEREGLADVTCLCAHLPSGRIAQAWAAVLHQVALSGGAGDHAATTVYVPLDAEATLPGTLTVNVPRERAKLTVSLPAGERERPPSLSRIKRGISRRDLEELFNAEDLCRYCEQHALPHDRKRDKKSTLAARILAHVSAPSLAQIQRGVSVEDLREHFPFELLLNFCQQRGLNTTLPAAHAPAKEGGKARKVTVRERTTILAKRIHAYLATSNSSGSGSSSGGGGSDDGDGDDDVDTPRYSPGDVRYVVEHEDVSRLLLGHNATAFAETVVAFQEDMAASPSKRRHRLLGAAFVEAHDAVDALVKRDPSVVFRRPPRPARCAAALLYEQGVKRKAAEVLLPDDEEGSE